jgi:hypothetical protein
MADRTGTERWRRWADRRRGYDVPLRRSGRPSAQDAHLIERAPLARLLAEVSRRIDRMLPGGVPLGVVEGSQPELYEVGMAIAGLSEAIDEWQRATARERAQRPG